MSKSESNEPEASPYAETRDGSSELGRELSLRRPDGLPVRVGNYRILRRIGEGGMGEVCLAEQTEPIQRNVALKFIKGGRHCSAEIVARFEAERQALAMMDHPNIAKILDGGRTEDGVPYFVMELVAGVPLTEYCDSKQLTVRERLELFVPVCRAVQHAHQKGIIHRDLKPSNVLVTTLDNESVPKVIDFGLAKAVDRQALQGDSSLETEFGQLLGTIRYMSPEQADLQRLDIDTRTDIYSLGVMLYELLTGTTPLDQQTLKNEAKLRILELIREREPQRPSIRLVADHDSAVSACESRQIAVPKLQNMLRSESDWVTLKALEIDRTRRYETAASFGEDIRRYLDDRTVLARPPTTWYRFTKLAKQYRGAFATAALLLAMLTAATVVSARYAVQSQVDKKDAVDAAKAANREKLAQQRVTSVMLQVIDAGNPLVGELLSRYGDGSASVAGVVKQVAVEELSDASQLMEFPALRGQLLSALGDVCLASSEIRLAQQVYEKSRSLLRESENASTTAYNRTVVGLGTCNYLFGDLEASEALLVDFLDETTVVGDTGELAIEVGRSRAF
ncbi:MAG: serine/threonine-protein kinase, partial [Planctomycetota bacterium]